MSVRPAAPADGPVGVRRVVRVVATVAAAVTLGACAPPADVEVEPPPAITVSLVQERIDIARGVMSIKVHNAGDAPVSVTAATYDDPRFALAPAWSGQRSVPAGSTRDIRVEVPEADCRAADGTAAGTSVLEFATADGSATGEYEVEDPFGFVSTTTGAACFTEQVAEVATVALSRVTTRSTADGDVMVLEIAVTARGEGGVLLGSVGGTGLLRPTSGDPTWPLETTVDDGAAVTIELEAVPARCDAHALAEDKVGTRFPVTLTVLGDEPAPGVLTLVATDAQRGELYDYISATCGLTS